jgi:hypothetical protein
MEDLALDSRTEMLPTQTPGRVRSEMEQLADKAVLVAIKQVDTAAKARAGRFADIAKNEAMYYGENTKALRGRNNVPFDSILMRGYVDTLHSKIDEKLQISFDNAPGRRQDRPWARKLTAALEFESGPDQGAWNIKDLGVKKLAIFSGRGIYKKYSWRTLSGEFTDMLEEVDHWDFLTEPKGGGQLDRHLFKGQINIFRSAQELRDNAKANYYNARQVEKLIRAGDDKESKKNQELYRHKVARAAELGLDYETTSYTGSQLFNLIEWVMYWRGEWYTLTFNYDHGTWLRFEKLADVYSVAKVKPGRGPWVSFATHYDPFEFWSLAPADSVRVIAYSMKKVVNLTLDNLEKRNWNQRAYDPNVFQPKDLIWKDGGLAKANIRPGQNIQNHIYDFQTPDTTNITINLTEWLDSFLGKQTGITNDTKGKSDEGKVGIYMGNMQEAADRLGLTNKMYEQAHVDLGVNFLYGFCDHAPEKYVVQIIGNDGVEWSDEIKRADLKNRKFVVRVRGTNAEEQMNAVLMQRKQNSLVGIQRDPELRKRINSTWYLREWLSLGGYESDEVRQALDVNDDADFDQIAEADQAIEDILAGREPKKNRGATTGFIRRIVEFAFDKEELDEGTFKRLQAFAEAHVKIADYNMQRKLRSSVAAIGTGTAPTGGAPAPQNPQMPPEMGAGALTPPMGPQGPQGGVQGMM